MAFGKTRNNSNQTCEGEMSKREKTGKKEERKIFYRIFISISVIVWPNEHVIHSSCMDITLIYILMLKLDTFMSISSALYFLKNYF
jgi:hypothetical protein